MTLTSRFTANVSTVALWLAEHPVAVSLAAAIVPVVLALALALFTHNTAIACPLGSAGGCGE
jgi:hypothetical protein